VYSSHQLTITFCCSCNDYVYDYFFLCYPFVEMTGRKKSIVVRKVKKDEKAKESIRVISSLECLPQPCKGFCKDSVECKCLSDLLEHHRSNINEVKMYFSNLSTDMWSQEEQGSDLLVAFADCLRPFCLNVSLKCPMFHFSVIIGHNEHHVTLCWRTFRLMLGLSRREAQFIKKVLLDNTRCDFFWNKVNENVNYLKENGRLLTDRVWYKYFIPNFIIAVPECGKAVRLLDTKLGGKVVTLSAKSLANLESLFSQHKPSHATTNAVSHGGHNILYGRFSRFCNEWNPFEKKFPDLHGEVANVATGFWNDDTCVAMLKPTYMVSRMMSSLPCIPQVAHTDFHVSVCRAAKSKPFIAFAPASNEGCMLLVWTKEKYTGKDEKEYFRHFYVYIPHGSMLFLPGDTVHAGGFTFGRTTGKEYTNHRIHFYICNGNGDDATMHDAENGMNYNHYSAEYKPEPGPLSIIQGRLNDRH